jgi:molybdopterin-guanine dinucleotide biosynthesis protein A
MTLRGVILAGGASQRMGRIKALLPVGETTLIEAVIARLREACPEILIVTNTPELYRHLGIPMVPDALPGRQSLVGIYTGVLHADGPVFVCACDMPFLNPALIRYLGSLADGVDVVIPRHHGEYEPLHAVYTEACLEPIRRCAMRQGRNTGFLGEVRVRVVEFEEIRRFDPDLRSFANVNTPGDYTRLRGAPPDRSDRGGTSNGSGGGQTDAGR